MPSLRPVPRTLVAAATLALLLAAAGACHRPPGVLARPDPAPGPPSSRTRRIMLEAVVATAREAGAVVLRHYAAAASGDLEVDRKADDSPVTAADRASNALLVERLQALLPGVPVLAEESEVPPYPSRRDWTRFWLVDPLDGTKEFLARNGEFTVNVALVENDEPVIGVVFAPALDVLYAGAAGHGAWRSEGEGPRVRIHSSPPPPDRPLTVAVSRSHGPDDLAAHLPGREVGQVIRSGSALKFGLIADGTADVYVRTTPTSEWDVAAGDCIWRNSARAGKRSSPFRYNKTRLRNDPFVLGLEP